MSKKNHYNIICCNILSLRNVFCTTKLIDTLKHSEREERKKIIKKKVKISEIIDEERKNREEILEVSTFFNVQITYLF